MEERVRMLAEYDLGHWSVSELCRRRGVSRDTFYAWRAAGRAGCGLVLRPVARGALVSASHGSGGGGSDRRASATLSPSGSTQAFGGFGSAGVGDGLAGGLDDQRHSEASRAWSEPARRRRRPLDPPRRVIAAEAANDESAADFEGSFRTKDQHRIDPLTITDSRTRFLIETRITAPTVEGAREVFMRVFATYGLPQAIRCDNGRRSARGARRTDAAFGVVAQARRRPHFIRPASPQENGRHERMHRTLKKQTFSRRPPTPGAAARFDEFRRHYNEERPHEALRQRPPAELYAPSPRPCRNASKTPGTTPTIRSAGWEHGARSNGGANSPSSARRSSGSSSAWPSSKTATMSSASADAISASSIAAASSVASLRPVRLRQPTETPQPKTVDHQPGPDCRGSARLNTGSMQPARKSFKRPAGSNSVSPARSDMQKSHTGFSENNLEAVRRRRPVRGEIVLPSRDAGSPL